MNLISGICYSCEKREYTFMVLRKYTIIFRNLYIPNRNCLYFFPFNCSSSSVSNHRFKIKKKYIFLGCITHITSHDIIFFIW